MHVRDACPQDAEESCSVVRRSISELCFLDHQGDAVTLQLWLANKTAANMRRWIGEHHVLVAVDENAICGVAAMTSTGEIILNYVSPDVRFRGVSKALLQGLEARAAKLDIPVLTLRSTSTAVRFYQAAGYAAAGSPAKAFGIAVGRPMQKGLSK
jgi:GNAT superfamily N-acetyltransferase